MSIQSIESTESREQLVERIKQALDKVISLQRNLEKYTSLEEDHWQELQWDLFDLCCILED